MHEFEDEEFVVIGVDVWDGFPKQVDAYFRQLAGATYPLLLSGSGVGWGFGLGENSFMVVDHEGVIRYRGSSFFNESQITEAVGKALNDMERAPLVETEDELPLRSVLAANYPNPFNEGTTILYSLADAGPVSLWIYDIDGRQVRELAGGTMPAGTHVVRWDGRDEVGRHLASGAYLYRLHAGGQIEARKMMLLR